MEGDTVGKADGVVGFPVGTSVGNLVGHFVGTSVGTWVGPGVGRFVGMSVGTFVGILEGRSAELGRSVGDLEPREGSGEEDGLWTKAGFSKTSDGEEEGAVTREGIPEGLDTEAGLSKFEGVFLCVGTLGADTAVGTIESTTLGPVETKELMDGSLGGVKKGSPGEGLGVEGALFGNPGVTVGRLVVGEETVGSADTGPALGDPGWTVGPGVLGFLVTDAGFPIS